MNFTIFCNNSRYLVRNLKLLKSQQDPVASLSKAALYKINLPKVAVLKCSAYDSNSSSSDGNANVHRPVISHKMNIDDQYNNKQNGEEDHNYDYGSKTMCGIGAGSGLVLYSASLWGLFGKKDDEETPEDKLITTIKRGILCIQREQYDKAEQMLHLALRMAQDLQNRDGITYVYDTLANLAMEREQFKKAEQLFADVMKRLFADGYDEDNPKVLHISSKMAHMAQLQGELDKALQGFTWTLKKLEENLRKMPDDKDVQELWGLTKNWFGQLLMQQGKYGDAKKAFQEAYQCLVEIYGKVNEEAITILNNLSVACVHLDDFAEAKKFLLQALELVKELKDTTQEGILKANLGLIYLREGLVSQAKETCTQAWRAGKKCKNHDAIEQAEYCLNEIKTFAQ